MEIGKNKKFIEKIKNRAGSTLKLEPVFYNTNLELMAISYLKQQTYLDFKKIKIILQKNFNNKMPFGYVLKNKMDKIVGFMGTLFSLRNYNNNFIFCNIHTWIIDKSHRYNSYLPLLPLIKKNYSITAFTPISSLAGLLEKFGFKKLRMNYRIIFLLNFLNQKKFIIETNDKIIKKLLKGNDLKIYKDYKNISCIKFLIIDRSKKLENIFVIGSKKRKKIFNVLNLLYVSNNERLKKIWPYFSVLIFQKYNVLFCGQYFLTEKDVSLPNKILISKNIKTQICMKNLPSNFKFDTLYSELI